MEKSAQITLRLGPSLKTKAEAVASRQNRSLGSLIEFLLMQHVRDGTSLDVFHTLAAQRYEDLVRVGLPDRTPPGRRQLSFAIRPSDLGEIEPARLLGAIRNALEQMHDTFNATMMFEPNYPTPIAPHFEQLREAGEVLQSWHEPGVHARITERDFWCISPSAVGSHIKPLQEDREDHQRPAAWLSPFLIVREVYELVLFARTLAAAAGKPGLVEFKCEWSGLSGRELYDKFAEQPYRPGLLALVDHRQTTGQWALDELADPAIAVAALAGPVLRLFDPTFSCAAGWVRQQARRFKGGV